MAEKVGTLSLRPSAGAASLWAMPRRLSSPRRPAPRRALAARIAPRGPRRITMLAFPDAQILDVTGPLEVFSIATRLLTARQVSGSEPRASEVHQASRDPGYRVEVVAASAGPVRMSSGLELVAERALHEV